MAIKVFNPAAAERWKLLKGCSHRMLPKWELGADPHSLLFFFKLLFLFFIFLFYFSWAFPQVVSWRLCPSEMEQPKLELAGGQPGRRAARRAAARPGRV